MFNDELKILVPGKQFIPLGERRVFDMFSVSTCLVFVCFVRLYRLFDDFDDRLSLGCAIAFDTKDLRVERPCQRYLHGNAQR